MPLHDVSPGVPLGIAHGVRATRASGNFSVGNNVLTAIAFTAEDYDTDAMHDNSTNNTRLTVPTIPGVVTGLWTFAGNGYTDVATGRTDVEVKLNGTATILSLDLRAGATSATGFAVAGQYVFTAGDYIELLVRTTAGTGNVIYDPPSPNFEMHFVGKVT